jgi:Kelch motif
MKWLIATIVILIVGSLLLTPACTNDDAVPKTSASGSVMSTGDMTAIRFDHAAALLPSGQVFIAGGIERNGVMQSTAELFDPALGRFFAIGKLPSPHGWGLTATLLLNGKILVAGGSTGCDSPCYTASAELYDPSTRLFVSTGGMTVARAGARALLLPTGDVLFVGGTELSTENPYATAELYHPATGAFSAAGPTHLHDASQLVLLKNGKALVVGSSEADIYDPSLGRFIATGGMTVPRTKFGAALLSDGQVLIVGGQTGGPWGDRLTSTQIYDPATGRFVPGPELHMKRFKLAKAVVPLKNGRILIAGGADQPEIYDPASRLFFLVPDSKLDGFYFSTATLLDKGSVLLTGGYSKPGGAGTNHAWVYQP